VQLWGPPQVAVLDVAMPAMDGLELLRRLRAATGISELPATFLSARVDRRTVEAAHAGGYEDLQMAVEQDQQRPPSP
jgi:CheY-like chemotaxis protein